MNKKALQKLGRISLYSILTISFILGVYLLLNSISVFGTYYNIANSTDAIAAYSPLDGATITTSNFTFFNQHMADICIVNATTTDGLTSYFGNTTNMPQFRSWDGTTQISHYFSQLNNTLRTQFNQWQGYSYFTWIKTSDSYTRTIQDFLNIKLWVSNGNLLLSLRDGPISGYPYSIDSGTYVTDNQWHYVGYSINWDLCLNKTTCAGVTNQSSAHVKMYVDGTQVVDDSGMTQYSGTRGLGSDFMYSGYSLTDGYQAYSEILPGLNTSGSYSSVNPLADSLNQSGVQLSIDYFQYMMPMAIYYLDNMTDSSGNGLTLTNSGTTNTTGVFGSGRALDGSSYIYNPTLSSSLFMGGSINFWAKLNDLSTEKVLVSSSDGVNSNAFMLARETDGSLLVNDIQAGVYLMVLNTTTGIVNDNNWHYYSLTFDGSSTYTLYVDGRGYPLIVSSGVNTAAFFSIDGTDMTFGNVKNNFGGWNGVNGSIDEISVFMNSQSAGTEFEMYEYQVNHPIRKPSTVDISGLPLTKGVSGNYTIGGAGTSDVNGEYYYAGDYDSKPSYNNSNGDYLYWSASSSQWNIYNSLDDYTSYYASTGNQSSPSTGVWVTSGGSDPPAKVYDGNEIYTWMVNCSWRENNVPGSELNNNPFRLYASSCTPNLQNTTFGAWTNSACNGDNLTQQRSATQYDANECGGANTTVFEFRDLLPNLVNDTGAWTNEGCINNLGDMNQSRTIIQYDTQDCAANTTVTEYQTTYDSTCDNQTYNFLPLFESSIVGGDYPADCLDIRWDDYGENATNLYYQIDSLGWNAYGGDFTQCFDDGNHTLEWDTNYTP